MGKVEAAMMLLLLAVVLFIFAPWIIFMFKVNAALLGFGAE